MRAKTCGLSDEQKRARRLHYCGTCKTIGALYNQKARFLLNHDTVFLAEILTALVAENIDDWQPAYQSYNCLNLPKTEIPLALEFAATANIVLAEFKVKDHLADTNQTRWKIAAQTFSKSFLKARRKLENRNFPFAELENILKDQITRESDPSKRSPAEALDFLAEPTAKATALFFSHGAKAVDKLFLQKAMYDLGFAFGKLIYLLDAFADYEKDVRQKQFNAFRAAYNLRESTLSGATRREIIEQLKLVQNEVDQKLDKLPLDDELKQIFTARLNGNLARNFKTNLPVLAAQKVCPPKRSLTITERWQKARLTAGELTIANFTARSLREKSQIPIAFVIVALVAFIAPHEAAKAKSWQDCAGMGFNLMFLGSLFGAVMTLPLKMAAKLPPQNTDKAARKNRKKAAQGAVQDNEGWCSYCDFCDCCDCEDGGCDCFDGSCCGCDSCDCCGGCDCGGCCD